MGSKAASICTLLIFAAISRAEAASFSAHISDQNGRPAANAVVMLIPQDKSEMPSPATRLGGDKLVDQRHEMFIPMVTIVPRGGRIAFANNDQTMHQVYSFSPVKQFELTLAHGQKSAPVTFDKAGVAAIGCNIHDDMIAYAFVTDSPWTAITNAEGQLQIADVPTGVYTAHIWHPRLPPGAAAPSVAVDATGPMAVLRTRITVLPEPKTHRRHGGGY
jgi:plastocyanin